jgi:hypothetical protein
MTSAATPPGLDSEATGGQGWERAAVYTHASPGGLSKLHSGDIVLPTTDGREIRLRRVTEPTAEQKSLLDLLGVSFPDRLSFNRQCSVDSATA